MKGIATEKGGGGHSSTKVKDYFLSSTNWDFSINQLQMRRILYLALPNSLCRVIYSGLYFIYFYLCPKIVFSFHLLNLHGSDPSPRQVPEELWIWKWRHEPSSPWDTAPSLHQRRPQEELCTLSWGDISAAAILAFHNSCCLGECMWGNPGLGRDFLQIPREVKNERRAWQTKHWGHLVSKWEGETQACADSPAKIPSSGTWGI